MGNTNDAEENDDKKETVSRHSSFMRRKMYDAHLLAAMAPITPASASDHIVKNNKTKPVADLLVRKEEDDGTKIFTTVGTIKPAHSLDPQPTNESSLFPSTAGGSAIWFVAVIFAVVVFIFI